MKKIVLFAILTTTLFAITTSCSKDEEVGKNLTKSSYTVSYDTPDVSGVTVDLTLFEYNSNGERIHSNAMTNCKVGNSKKFTATTNAQKVKVFLTMSGSGNSKNTWVQQVYYLIPNSDVNITLNMQTIAGNLEP